MVPKDTKQYALSERRIQTLCNTTRRMLKVQITKVFWSEALRGAVYILNNVPRKNVFDLDAAD
jgi:hypothetical protein